jgi:hypothetical protein
MPSLGQYLPGVQNDGAALPGGHTLPAGQMELQLTAPVSGWYEPPGQGTPAVSELRGQYVPTGHTYD